MVWTEWQNWLHGKRSCITEFKPERAWFLNLGRSIWQYERGCPLDSSLIQSLSSSLHVDISRFLATVVRISRHKPQGRRWRFKEKALALSTLKCAPNSYSFLWTLFPLPSRLTLQTILNTIHFRTGINAHVFSMLRCTLQTISNEAHVLSHVWWNANVS